MLLTRTRLLVLVASFLALLAPVPRASAQAEPASPTEPAPAETPSVPPASSATGSSEVPAANRDWLKVLYDKAQRSVVRIETDLGLGTGFFYFSPQHVATAYHVVENARSIDVALHGDVRLPATVVAWDKHYDLAILRIEGPVPKQPVLEPYTGPIVIGMPVAVLGHPYADLSRMMPQLRGLLNWSLTQGIVGAVSESWIQTDAAVNPGNSGGPLLASDGRLLGVISARLREAEGIGLVTHVARLEELTRKIGMPAPPVSSVRFDSVELGWTTYHVEEGEISGFMFGAGLEVARHWLPRLRLTFAEGDFAPAEAAVTEREVKRFATELELGYALLDSIFRLSVQVGISLDYDRIYDTRLSVIDGGPEIDKSVDRDSDWSARPMLGVTPEIGPLRFNYAYQISPNAEGGSQHRWYVALAF